MHSKTPWHVEPAPQGGYVISNEADGFSICLRTAWPNRADESTANAKLLVNSVNAIAALADHLGVDAGELAKRLADGGMHEVAAALHIMEEHGSVLASDALRLLRGKE